LIVASKVGTKNLYGIEIVENLISNAEQKGISVKRADLNSNFPFDDNTFDVVHANQVIEHLFDTDNFLNEVYRILKRGGVRCGFN
jgi:ubiquinone/menaquinone biosynthesis C-methylase UbiE